MSTEIAEFRLSKTGDNISVNRFFGGKDYGSMIQLTNGRKYVQLTRREVAELVRILIDSYNYTKYPSE